MRVHKCCTPLLSLYTCTLLLQYRKVTAAEALLPKLLLLRYEVLVHVILPVVYETTYQMNIYMVTNDQRLHTRVLPLLRRASMMYTSVVSFTTGLHDVPSRISRSIRAYAEQLQESARRGEAPLLNRGVHGTLPTTQ